MIFGFLANLFSCGAAEKVDLPGLVQSGALVIDVRTPGEFSSGAVKGAINIPYDEIARKISSVESDKSRAIIVYCQSGSRSGAAKKSLERAGYTQVVNAGGFCLSPAGRFFLRIQKALSEYLRSKVRTRA